MNALLRNQKIGFIGCGNMGSAVLRSLIERRAVSPAQIFIFDAVFSKAKALAGQFGVRTAKSSSDLIDRCDLVFLAVKPQDFSELSRELKFALNRQTKKKLVISILAGTSVQKLKAFLGKKAVVIRAMPNLGAQAGESMTAITGAGGVYRKRAEAVFSSCGKVMRLPERYFDLVTAVSGSGPAYFFFLMELLAGFARKSGLSEKAAEVLAVQTAVGAAKLASQSPDSPAVLRARVTSKKGTTAAALDYLFHKKFDTIFLEGLKRAFKRSRELSRI